MSPHSSGTTNSRKVALLLGLLGVVLASLALSARWILSRTDHNTERSKIRRVSDNEYKERQVSALDNEVRQRLEEYEMAMTRSTRAEAEHDRLSLAVETNPLLMPRLESARRTLVRREDEVRKATSRLDHSMEMRRSWQDAYIQASFGNVTPARSPEPKTEKGNKTEWDGKRGNGDAASFGRETTGKRGRR
jgi:hypothetical protein